MKKVRLKHATVGAPDYGLNMPADQYASEGVRFLRTTDIADDGRLNPNAEPVFIPEAMTNNALIQKGDLLLSRSGTVGRSYLHDGQIEAAYAGYLVRFRPRREVDPRFLLYWTKSKGFADQVALEGTQSTIVNVNAQKYANMELQLPSPERQVAISDFLDRETERIDALVVRKRRLIELLEERRTALISHVVTKGLDPTVPMKDSGIPWLGEIPVHWELMAFRRVCTLQRGFDLPSEQRVEGPVPLVTSGGIGGHVAEARATGPGVVTGRYGSVGEVYYIEEDYWPLNTTLFSIRFQNVEPRFVYYLLQHLPIDAEAGKSAVPGVSRQDIHPMRIGLPPIEEQRSLIRQLDEFLVRKERLALKVGEQLTLLAEYRQALVTAAVTGQIDLESEPPDPEESLA